MSSPASPPKMKVTSPPRRKVKTSSTKDPDDDFGLFSCFETFRCFGTIATALLSLGFLIAAAVLTSQWVAGHPNNDKIAAYNNLVSAWPSVQSVFAGFAANTFINTSLVAAGSSSSLTGSVVVSPVAGNVDTPPVVGLPSSYPQRKLAGSLTLRGSVPWPAGRTVVAGTINIAASLAGNVPAGSASLTLPLAFLDTTLPAPGASASPSYYYQLSGVCLVLSGATPLRLAIAGLETSAAAVLAAADHNVDNVAVSPGCAFLPSDAAAASGGATISAVPVPQTDANTPLGGGGGGEAADGSFPIGAQGRNTYNSVGLYTKVPLGSGALPASLSFPSPLSVEYRSAADPWSYAVSVGSPNYSGDGSTVTSVSLGSSVSTSVKSALIACWFLAAFFAAVLLLFNLPPLCSSASRIVSGTDDQREDSQDARVMRWCCSCFCCGAFLAYHGRHRSTAAVARRRALGPQERYQLSWLFAGASYVVFLILGALAFPSGNSPALVTCATATMSSAGLGGTNPNFAGAVVSMGCETYGNIAAVTVGSKAHALFGLEISGFIFFHGTPAALLLLALGSFIYALFVEAAGLFAGDSSRTRRSMGICSLTSKLIEKWASSVLACSLVFFPAVGVFFYALGSAYLSALGYSSVAFDGRCSTLTDEGLSPTGCSFGIATTRYYAAAAAFGCVFLTTVFALLLSSWCCYGGTARRHSHSWKDDVLLPLTGWLAFFGSCGVKCGDGSWKNCRCCWPEDLPREAENVWPPPPPPSLCRVAMSKIGLAPPLPLPKGERVGISKKDLVALDIGAETKEGPLNSTPLRAAAGVLGRLALAQNESPMIGRGQVANPLPRLGLSHATISPPASVVSGPPSTTATGKPDLELESAASRGPPAGPETSGSAGSSSTLDSSQILSATNSFLLQSPQIKLASLSAAAAAAATSNVSHDPHDPHGLSKTALANLSSRLLLVGDASPKPKQAEVPQLPAAVVIPLPTQPSFRLVGALERSSSALPLTSTVASSSSPSASPIFGQGPPSIPRAGSGSASGAPAGHFRSSSQRHIAAVQDATAAAENAAAAALRRQLELSAAAGGGSSRAVSLSYFRPESVASEVARTTSPAASPARVAASPGRRNSLRGGSGKH